MSQLISILRLRPSAMPEPEIKERRLGATISRIKYKPKRHELTTCRGFLDIGEACFFASTRV